MAAILAMFKSAQRLSAPVKASITFTFVGILTQGMSIITIPIFTRIMPSSEIGVVTTFVTWYALIGTFAGFSLASGSFSIAMNEFPSDRDGYISSAMTFSCLTTLLTGIILWLASPLISAHIPLSTELWLLMFAGFLFNPAYNFWSIRQRYEFKYKLPALLAVLVTIAATAASVVSVLHAKNQGETDLGLYRLASSGAVTYAVGFFFLVFVLVKGKTFYNKKYWLFIIKVNSPLIIHILARQILDFSDRAMITSMVGLSAVAVYGVLSNLSHISLIVWTAINVSLVPYMFDKLNQDPANEQVAKVVKALLISFGAVCILLALAAPEIVSILATQEYYEAIYIVPPIVAGIYLTSLYSVFSNVLLYHKKTTHIMLATFVAAVINVTLNAIFIRAFGYQAAAYTTLASYLLLSFFQYLAMRFVHRASLFKAKEIWGITTAVICFCLMSLLLYQNSYLRYAVVFIIACVVLLKRQAIIKLVRGLRTRT